MRDFQLYPRHPSTPETEPSGLPTPDFSLSVKSFKHFMTPSPQPASKRRRISPAANDEGHLPSTQALVDAAGLGLSARMEMDDDQQQQQQDRNVEEQEETRDEQDDDSMMEHSGEEEEDEGEGIMADAELRVDDVSAVMENLDDFLGNTWDLNADLAKARAERDKENRSVSGSGNGFDELMGVGIWD
ncbi:hypothetical protein N0V88_000036 [Collariella sp. IMI 366227]|nr:hypothetical protein N0V88_000036 [Collariella sp. IMI 366227]